MAADRMNDRDNSDLESRCDELLLLAKVQAIHEKQKGSPNRELKFSDILRDDADLVPYIFSGRNMRNMRLRGADLRRIDFQGSDLSGCDITNGRIANANFDLCKASRVTLRRTVDWADHVLFHSWRTPRLPFLPSPGDRFSLAPYLPELVILSSKMLAKCRNFDLPEAEEMALRSGRLAIALRPVSMMEWRAVVEDDREITHDPFKMTVREARTYFDRLEDMLEATDADSPEHEDPPAFVTATFPSTKLTALLDDCRLLEARNYADRPDDRNVEHSTVTDCTVSDLWLSRPHGNVRPEFSAKRDGTPLVSAFLNFKCYQLGDRVPLPDETAYLRPIFFLRDLEQRV